MSEPTMTTIACVLYVIAGCALYERDRLNGKTYPAWLVIPAWPIPYIALMIWAVCQPVVLLVRLWRLR